jgi:hypothetical protein
MQVIHAFGMFNGVANQVIGHVFFSAVGFLFGHMVNRFLKGAALLLGQMQLFQGSFIAGMHGWLLNEGGGVHDNSP